MSILELPDPNRKTALRLDMRGPAFEAGIPLPLMIESLGHVQGLLDKAYLGLIDRRRLSKEDRVRFFLQTQRVEHGSLTADLGVIFTGAQTVLPIVGALGPNGIWEYAKSAFEFIKVVFESTKKGQQVSYIFNADKSAVQVNTGTQTQTYNGSVYNIASMSIGHYQGLAQTLDRSQVTDIRLGEGEQRDIGLSLSERDLFVFPSRVEDDPYRIECEIYEFDKFDKDGRLRIGPDQAVPEGAYKFAVVGSQAAADYVAAMLKQSVRVTCLREISENPINGEKIYRLQVISVEA